VQNDPLEQISEGEIEIIRKGAQDLERPLFDTDPGLDTFE